MRELERTPISRKQPVVVPCRAVPCRAAAPPDWSPDISSSIMLAAALQLNSIIDRIRILRTVLSLATRHVPRPRTAGLSREKSIFQTGGSSRSLLVILTNQTPASESYGRGDLTNKIHQREDNPPLVQSAIRLFGQAIMLNTCFTVYGGL